MKQVDRKRKTIFLHLGGAHSERIDRQLVWTTVWLVSLSVLAVVAVL